MSDLADPDELFHELECQISELSGLVAALTLIDAAGPDESGYWPALHALHDIVAHKCNELTSLIELK